MAIGTPVNIGTVANKTNQATTVLTTIASVPAGATIFFIFACDDVLTLNPTVVDSASNTYTTNSNLSGQNVGNVYSQLYYIHNASALASGGTITITWVGTAPDSKAITAFYVTGLKNASQHKDGNATGSNGVPTVSTSAATTVANALTIGVLATEGPDGDAFTQDASPAYATPPNRLGTTGGGAASNITIAGGYFIETTTGTKTYNPTCGSRDWASFIAVFEELPSTPIKNSFFLNQTVKRSNYY